MAPSIRHHAIALLLAGGLFLLPVLTVPPPASAQEKSLAPAAPHPCDGDVWCGLFLARPGKAAEDPGETTAGVLVKQLGKAFPDFGTFQLVGENSGSVYKEYECWVVPSQQLFLKLDSLGPQPEKGGVHLHLQLWQREHVLLKSDAFLRRRPLFIAGPGCEGGRLIMVLKLADPPAP